MRAFSRASRLDAASLGPSPHRTGMVADLETASQPGPAGELGRDDPVRASGHVSKAGTTNT
ncbi:hypothetical protein AGR8A_pAt20084 [Agrobacterium fabrum str. J-07]|nr:hypothetical protein AGR8A_pAt20084 [Agrobacterium fabrum str. J-07]